MKKRRFLAALLVTTMALSTVASATSNSPTGQNADDSTDYSKKMANTYSQGVNSYDDGYFYLELPGDLAFTIDPARQNGSLQVRGADYNIKNLGLAPTEITVYPSIAPGAEDTWAATNYKVLPSAPGLVTGHVWSNGQYITTGAAAYDDISTKKGLFLTVIPADMGTTYNGTSVDLITTAQAVTFDINKDDTFEFNYSAKQNELGIARLVTRQALSGEIPVEDTNYVYLREPYKGATGVSGTSVIISKGIDKRVADIDINSETDPTYNYSTVMTGDSLKFFLPSVKDGKKITSQNDPDAVIGYTNSIASFTIAGAVNADSVYDAGSILFQAVYDIKSATEAKQNGYKFVTGKGLLIDQTN